MRYQGRITDWKDDRGFGFITRNDGAAKVFMHISALPGQGPRPSVGMLVTYQLGKSTDGRSRAEEVRFVETSATPRRISSDKLMAGLSLIVLLLPAAYVAWVRISHPGSTVSASFYKIVFAREALKSNTEFRCTPKKSSCSAMTSCAEAFFHQERCGVSNMDGDRDGIPCEQQWCN